MARIKKYWIRYNEGADRIEQTVTEARFRPQGFGWKEVTVDMCCNIPIVVGCDSESLEIQSEIVEDGDNYYIILSLNGVAIATVESAVDLADAVETINTQLAGLAVFTITEDNRVQANLLVCGDFTIEAAEGAVPGTEDIQGTIQVDALAGAADITFVTAAGQGGAVFVSGDDLLPQVAGDTGEFTFLNGLLDLTVYGDGIQLGLIWRVTDSNGVIQELPYAGGFSANFNDVFISSDAAWTVEIVPEP